MPGLTQQMSLTLPMDAPVTSPHEAETDAAHAERPGSARILLFAFLGEGALLLIGLLWILVRDLPFAWSDAPRVSLAAATAIGLLTAFGLAAVQLVLLRLVPERGPVRALRRLYRELLFPLFRTSTPLEIVVISVLAGIGEEVLFRGAMQPEWGLIATSLVFGLFHIGGRLTMALGIWAACTGALLGWLTIATGGLLAPIVAHIAYDALALSYLRWGPALPDTSGADRLG
jgi:membrane protease YdiL (CAAX protease family)